MQVVIDSADTPAAGGSSRPPERKEVETPYPTRSGKGALRRAATDPDLPGDENFRAAPGEVVVGGMLANVIPRSTPEQQAIHHNQLRYAELQKLRNGQPNLYRETRYR